MSSHRPHSNRDDDKRADDPPMSRLFIICNKNQNEDDFRDAFEKFGTIEEVWVVRDKTTGDNKGIVYIKFNKTSSAALALEEMNGKVLPNSSRPIKVLVASSRNQGSGRQENEQEKYVRLFVIVPKDMSEDDLRAEFDKYGEIENISVIKDKVTKERKGFAYIKYTKFSHAAEAFESCGSKFKAVFAEPKSSSRSSQGSFPDRSDSREARSSRYDDYSSFNFGRNESHGSFVMPIVASVAPTSSEAQLNIICSSSINQDQLWRLFDIIPGLDFCQITGDCGRNSNYATAVYNNNEAAIYAREKLHGLEYPPGERIIIRPVAPAVTAKKESQEKLFPFEGPSKELFCSVSLPSVAPLAKTDTPCAQRCFIVCVPKALPSKMLSNIFCRFGDLLDVYMLQNKNCGYAKYASEESASNAIKVLNGAEICGVKLKVMEAEEPRDAKRKRYDDNLDSS
ncbi:hypothetical protein HA402_015307 [Bradysia odoriphaga]|nr:hypothetical protein HA402_015307 [Bradysia odoriphaga]